MSIKGIRLSDGTVEKYDFPYLDNIDVQLQHLGSDVLAVLNNKADIDGSYINLNAGTADNLNSSVGIEDQAPYNFRTTGGSADVGDRMNLKAVVGGTVAWNQLAALDATKWSKSYASVSFSGGKTIIAATDSGSSRIKTVRFAVIPNHKHLVLGTFIGSDSNLEHSGIAIGIYSGANNNSYSVRVNIVMGTNTDTSINNVWDSGANGNYFGFTFPTAGTTAEYAAFDKLQVIDLTQMFGSAIADYVYTLESGTAGAGIAWLKKYGWFTKPYYPYKAASLESVKTSAHKTIGFNQWDEEWEVGGINTTTGANNDSLTDRIRSKNYIPVVGGQNYYFKAGTSGQTAWQINGVYYDGNKNVIDSFYVRNDYKSIPNNCAYIRFMVTSGYGTTYNHDICINLHWDGERDGEYEPYEQHTYALDDVELRGIPKLDASNNLYYDSDQYTPDGTVERKFGEYTFSGSETWGFNESSSFFQASFTTPNGVTAGTHLTSNGIFVNVVNGHYARAYLSANPSLSASSDMNTVFASGTKMVYELATPTTESADPYQQTQIVDDFGTEEFVDAAVEANERDVAIPVGHETFYQNNLKAKLEMAPNSPDGDGLYVVQQISGENTYVPLVVPNEIPDAPTTDGTYVLKASVSDGTVTYSWVTE